MKNIQNTKDYKLFKLDEPYMQTELISDVLLWTPTHGRTKSGRPARTYIQQLCEDIGCCPEDLPEAMNDRKKWRERVRDIRVIGTTWWWWWRHLNRLDYSDIRLSDNYGTLWIYIATVQWQILKDIWWHFSD